MGIFDGCLLACDIDGTLVSGELLPERNVERIEYFVSEGGAFSLSTGRTAAAVSMITEKIKCISPSVLSNGCVLYDFEKKAPIFQKRLPGSSIDMVSDVLKKCDIGMELHTADRIFVPRRSAASDLHERYERMTAEFAGMSEIPRNDINKVIYFVEDMRQFDLLEKLSEKYKNDCTFYRTCAFIGGERQDYFEQIPNGVSKADTLNKLCTVLGIKKGGFFAIGDYYNDVPMLKAADISAVPEDSPDDVKAEANRIVCGARYGAVADFIDYLKESLPYGKTN